MNEDDKDLDYFLVRANEFADEAKEHGLSVAIVIENSDPIAREASIATVYRGTQATLTGLLQCALWGLRPR